VYRNIKQEYSPIVVDEFLYILHWHGPLVTSTISSLMLHCCIQLVDEPHSKTKLLHPNV
jgi:hypothetical protein